jgi:hypothetical protein
MLLQQLLPGFVVNLVAKARGVDNGERDAGALLIEFCRDMDLAKGPCVAWLCNSGRLWSRVVVSANCVPTVIGLILTPSSRCAVVGSSESLCSSTFWPQRVLTNVVLPA